MKINELLEKLTLVENQEANVIFQDQDDIQYSLNSINFDGVNTVELLFDEVEVANG